MDRAYIDRMSRELIEAGQPIAAGFAAARLSGIIPDSTPPEELDRLRVVFMNGAQHAWSMLFAALDEEREPTDGDMRRMEIINSELDAWYQIAAKKYGLPQRKQGRPHA
jgi:hypothetical protein